MYSRPLLSLSRLSHLRILSYVYSHSLSLPLIPPIIDQVPYIYPGIMVQGSAIPKSNSTWTIGDWRMHLYSLVGPIQQLKVISYQGGRNSLIGPFFCVSSCLYQINAYHLAFPIPIIPSKLLWHGTLLYFRSHCVPLLSYL